MALAGGHEHDPDHHRDLEPTQRSQHLDRLDHLAVARLRAFEHHHQVRELLVIHLRAGDDQVAHRAVGQPRQDQRGALVRADTDAGQDRQIAAQLLTDLHARAHAGMRQLHAHGRGDTGVARAVSDLAHQQLVVRDQVFGHPAVDHRQLHALGPGEHAQRQLIGQQQTHRVVRGPPVRVADAINCQAVVGGKDEQLRVMEERPQRVLHQPEPYRQRLELAQAATGFVPAVELFAQGPFQRGVGGGCDQRSRWGRHGASV